MKILSKKSLIICLLLILSIYVVTCFLKRKIEVLGFAYENDVIRISQSNISLQTIVVDNSRKGQRNICYFYKKFNYYVWGNKTALTVELDSGTHKLLDTIIILFGKNVNSVISVENPEKTRFKRRLFLVDGTDKRIVIP